MLSEDRVSHWFMRPGLDNLEAFPERLKDCVETYATCAGRKIIIDLGELETVNSTVLGALLRSAKAAIKSGGSVALVRVNDKARRLIVISRLEAYFPIYDSEVAALKQMRADKAQGG